MGNEVSQVATPKDDWVPQNEGTIGMSLRYKDGEPMQVTIKHMNTILEDIRRNFCQKTEPGFVSLMQASLEHGLYEYDLQLKETKGRKGLTNVSCKELMDQASQLEMIMEKVPTVMAEPELGAMLRRNISLIKEISTAWLTKMCESGDTPTTESMTQLAQQFVDAVCHKQDEKVTLKLQKFDETRLTGIALGLYQASKEAPPPMLMANVASEEPRPEPRPEPKPKREPRPKPEPRPEPKAEPRPEPRPEPKPKREPQRQPELQSLLDKGPPAT